MTPIQVVSKRLGLLFLILCSGTLMAQNDTTKTGNLETEKLIIVKSYSPTVSDAVKLKQTPEGQVDSTVLEKKDVKYNIISVPVASTFVPEKGKAVGMAHQKQPSLYNSYVALGLGNYTNILAKFYSNIEVNEQQDLSIGLEHHSSQGGIENALLDDSYYNTQVSLGYNAETENVFWGANVGFMHQLYNWYGITNNIFSSNQLHSFDPKHNYTGISLGGNIETKQGVFKEASLFYRHFGDDFNSSEDHIIFKPSFEFEVGHETAIETEFSVKYLNGKFAPINGIHRSYSMLDLGVEPSFNLMRDKWTLHLGAELVYSAEFEKDESEVLLFPKVKASYRVAGDYFTLYAGVNGSLDQNTYYEFSQNNPYVKPYLEIEPTKTEYHVYFGGKGKFTEELHYDLRASYKAQEHKALFAAFTPVTSAIVLPAGMRPYQYNNAFQVVYDAVTTFSVHGALGLDLNEKFNMGIRATYFNYSTEHQAEAWNLPSLKAAITAGYQITDKWAVGADFFYVGQRHDFINLAPAQTKIVDVEGYLDANFQVNFQATEQLGFFLRGNNLLDDNYGRWYNYPVQGIQGMIGMSYQF